MGDINEEIRERALAQLSAIEHSYTIKILNKQDIARIIAQGVEDKRVVLSICTSLNYWVMSGNMKGDVTVPHDIVLMLIERLRSC